MREIARIASLYVYPVKSCAGVSVERMILTPTGPKNDRRFMLMGTDGRFLTQRDHPRMCLIKPCIHPDGISLSGPEGGRDLFIANSESGVWRTAVDVWGYRGEGMDMGARMAKWFSDQLGVQCRLIQLDAFTRRAREDPGGGKDIPLSWADSGPVTIIGNGSLADLNAKAAEAVPMGCFRPNIVVDGCIPFAEDGWETVCMGSAALRGFKLAVRCAMVLVDQATGIPRKSGEPLRTLAKYRRLPALPGEEAKGVVFGKKFACAREGEFSVGGAIEAQQ